MPHVAVIFEARISIFYPPTTFLFKQIECEDLGDLEGVLEEGNVLASSLKAAEVCAQSGYLL